MFKTIIVIDDQQDQAKGLASGLQKKFDNSYRFENYYLEEDILEAINNRFFYLAIIDIRMDAYNKNGIEIAETIFKNNPLAKVILVSAFKAEYFYDVKELMKTGKVIDVLDKEPFSTWIPKLSNVISDYFKKLDEEIPLMNQALLNQYADAKNEPDSYLKGVKFEGVIFSLFGSMGFDAMTRRVIDQSRNETDIILRNDIDDPFLSKFGKYILIECKNWPQTGVGKNELIVFYSKVTNTNGFSNLGILATTGHIAHTAYKEAVRYSGGSNKILFLDGPLIESLILSPNRLEKFKRIIDRQVKDN